MAEAAPRPHSIDDGYPIIVRLHGRRVLVVGGGTIALRKVEGLLAAGASITVVSPHFVDGFASFEGSTPPDGEVVADGATSPGDVELVHRRYAPSDVVDMWLVVAATDDADVQRQIFDDGEVAGVWVNAVDDPQRCSFILPAVERRGPVIVAVSTQGRSPALAGQLRDYLAERLPADIAEIAERVSDERRSVKERGGSTEDLVWPNPLIR